ncbi:unnamed protein product [Alternaria alternata]
MALPDSGSEYDLVSLQFAVARGFEIHSGTERTEVADGSSMFSCGFIRTTLSVGTHFDSKHAPRSKVAIAIDFDVVEGLPHDVVIGERHLEELRVFTDNKHALITSSHATTVEELNHIRCPGPIDKSLSWIKQRLGSGEELNPTASEAVGTPIFSDSSNDQRENARREREAARIATLPTVEQQPAIEAEAVEQQAYESRNQHTAVGHDPFLRNLPPPLNPNPTKDVESAIFRCDHPGCSAAPFQTQYLLKCVVP